MPIGAAASNPRKFYNRRALLGVLLMVVAVALVLLAIRLAAQMDTYYVAKKPLVVGQSVGPQDLGTIQANPGNAAGKYLSTHTPLSKDLVATQNIDTGELVPKSALMETVPDMKSVVVELCAPLPKRVKAGDYMELWQLPDADSWRNFDSEAPPPRAVQIATEAILVEVVKSESTLSTSSKVSIEVMVEQSELNNLLVAVGIEAPLMAIPVVS